MERTIRVTGKGKISVTPDTIRLLIKQTNVTRTYEDAVKDSAESKKFLNEAFVSLGFKKKWINQLKPVFFCPKAIQPDQKAMLHSSCRAQWN